VQARDNPGVESTNADSPFEELCGVHIGQAWGMASRLTTCSADADDVMQDALVVAWTKRAVIPPDPWPWFCTVITNCARNHQRKNARVRPMPDIDPDSSVDDYARPESAAQADELRIRIHNALSELSTEEHEAVALCLLGGLSHAEASKATGTNLNTIKARVRRGTERLRKKLKHRPEGIEAFLALPALPPPSGGLNNAVSRWTGIAKSAAPVSFLPRLTATQMVVAGFVAATLMVGMLLLALNLSDTGQKELDVSRQNPQLPLDAGGTEEPQDSSRPLPDQVTPENNGNEAESAQPDDPGTEAATPGEPPAEDTTDSSNGTGTEPELFPIFDKHPSGALRSAGYFVKTDTGNFVHGHWQYFYPSGELVDEGDYVMGAKQGTWKHYYRNSTVASIGNYVDNKKHGLWQFYREDNSPEAQGEFLEDEQSGTWTYYFPGGEICQTVVWLNGKRNGWCRRFDLNGTLVFETEYADDMRNGMHIEYDPLTRRERRESRYVNGVKHGVEIIHDPYTGGLLKSAVYRLGVRQGE